MKELMSLLFLTGIVTAVLGFLWLVQRSATISALKAYDKWKEEK